MYCAIIGDLIGSRQLEQRYEVQEQLVKVLQDMNNQYEETIAAKFTITLGDEFQGLMVSSSAVLSILDAIRFEMHPVKIRFGIGFGAMATMIRQEAAIGADGPAFHAAREGLKAIKEKEDKYEQAYSDTMIYVYEPETNGYKDLELLNATLSSTRFIADKWTEKQRDIIKLVEKGELSQREIGDQLGITQSSVQRRLTSGGYHTYRNSREACIKYLEALWEGLNEQ